MAQRVIGVLSDLLASVTDATPLAELMDLVRERYLAEINEELAAAKAANYARLQSWLGDLVGELNATVAEMEAALAEARLAIASPLTTDKSNDEGDRLLNVTEGLSIPPSVPPANTLQLSRAVQRSFAADADGGLQVANAVRPDFKGILATALANVEVTPTNSLEVYAMRLKTGVYGNTAPLKPITDRQGKVVGLQEWPLQRHAECWRGLQ